MHLTPKEGERLLLSAAADLARRRLSRGARVGAPEAVALVSDEVCEMAWDGLPLTDIVTRACSVIPPPSLLPGVPSAVPLIEVEALTPHGTMLVHVDAPFGPPATDGPGAVRVGSSAIELAAGRERVTVSLHNTGKRDIWVSSHMPLGHLNRAMKVSISDPDSYRLDLPAGSALKVPPATTTQATAVRLRGNRAGTQGDASPQACDLDGTRR